MQIDLSTKEHFVNQAVLLGVVISFLHACAIEIFYPGTYFRLEGDFLCYAFNLVFAFAAGGAFYAYRETLYEEQVEDNQCLT